MPYNVLKPLDLFERIKGCCDVPAGSRPPFTLILGSGFSYGIIPTTAQVVREDLPWWKRCQRREDGGPKPEDYIARNESAFAPTAKEDASRFWERIAAARAAGGLTPLVLDKDQVPADEAVGEAYRFALSAGCAPGLSSPHQVRRYFGDIIRRVGRRLNPAHVFLASIIAEQPRLIGTIFTTNFDPLLQRSLQLVNAPYYVSDRPDTLQHADDDDVVEAVHVVHAHGSIYRYLLVNSPAEIEAYANLNRNKLQEYFRNHAVLIIGFSGWDDAITRALSSVDQFAHNLYWVGRADDPDKSDLTADAKGILGKHHNAFYISTSGADALMAQMHQHVIGHFLPRLFREPILVARDQLALCDLRRVRLPRTSGLSILSSEEVGAESSNIGINNEDLDLGQEVAAVRKRLEDAQKLFTGEASTDAASLLAAQVRQRLSQASNLYLDGKYHEALPHFDFAIANNAGLTPAEHALVLYRRGYTLSKLGDNNRALADFTAVIEMPEAPADERAGALLNRGVTYGTDGEVSDVQRAIDDYTAVIDMPKASANQRALAHRNRGVVYRERGVAGDVQRAIDDFTAVIEMSEAPAEQQAKARVNRGFVYGARGESGDVQRAIDDYTAVIEMPEAPADQLAFARHNRGVTYGARGESGDVQRAIDDCTALIEMPEVPAEQRAKAYHYRGLTYEDRGNPGDSELAKADFQAVLAMPDAPQQTRDFAKTQIEKLTAEPPSTSAPSSPSRGSRGRKTPKKRKK
jgi:tetratricopeptide (TPR) repeat protein